MKPFLMGLLMGGILSGAAIWRFAAPHEEAHAVDEPKPKEYAEHAKDGTISLKLENAQQKQMGLSTAVLAKASLRVETLAYGRVLNAAELPLQLAEISVAEVALRGSQLAYDRLKKLNSQAGTISEQKVEEAQEVLKKDEVALQSAQVKLLTSWGLAVASRPNLGDLAKQIAANEASLIRLDLLPGEKTTQKSVRVALPGAEDQAIEAEVLGPAPQADPVTQSASLICLAKARGWIPGAALVGWLTADGNEEAGVNVPRSALLRHEGLPFVYRRHDDEFARVPVTLMASQGASWLVTGDLKPGDEVVVTGAQQLLSEEMKGRTEPD